MTFIYQRCQRNFAIFGENYNSEVVTTYQEERCPEDEIGGGDDHVHLDPRDPLRLQVLDVALDLDALRRRDGQQVLAVLTYHNTLLIIIIAENIEFFLHWLFTVENLGQSLSTSG